MFGFTDNKNPIQLYQIDSRGVRCFCMPPCAELERYVNYYWWLEVLPGDTTLEVIPDNATDLVMSPEIGRYSILYLSSPEKFSIPLTGPATYVGISFNAAALFRYFNLSRDAMNLCQPGEDTTHTLSIEDMVDSVQSLLKPEQLKPVFDKQLLTRLERKPGRVKNQAKLDIDKVLVALQGSVGLRGMESVAAHFGLSDRQFRRVMASLFGYGPKKVQRVMRLQSALNEILNVNPSMLDDGYFDEPHKIKEFHAMTGLTPGQLKKMAEIYNSME